MTIFDYIKKLDKNCTFFEIGCHHGYDTEKIVEVLPEVNLYAFEPDPRNISIIKKRKLDQKVKLIESCVSNKEGKETFHLSSGLPPILAKMDEQTKNLPDHIQLHPDHLELRDFCQSGEWSASSSIKKPKEHLETTPWCTFDKTIEVDSITVDSFCNRENINKIDFIWMDVQGAEDLVFEGASDTLTNNKVDYIYTEFSDKELYENQMNLKQIKNSLPNYETVDFFNEKGGTDVLLKNKNL